MTNEDNFCTGWCSTATEISVLVHTDCKQMGLCPVRAFF